MRYNVEEALERCKDQIPENELIAYPLRMFYKETGACGDDVWLRMDASGIYEARCKVYIMGECNNPTGPENPFADDFYDNYAKGRATTRQKAIELMIQDIDKLADMLWETP